MTDNIIQLWPSNIADTAPEEVLKMALAANLRMVVVIGLGEDDTEFFAPSMGSGASCLWALERAKKRLLDIVDD